MARQSRALSPRVGSSKNQPIQTSVIFLWMVLWFTPAEVIFEYGLNGFYAVLSIDLLSFPISWVAVKNTDLVRGTAFVGKFREISGSTPKRSSLIRIDLVRKASNAYNLFP